MSEKKKDLLAPMVYDSPTAKEVAVTIGDQEYKIVQASSKTERLYRASIVKGLKRGRDGSMQVGEGLIDSEVLLLKKCLFKQVNGSWVAVEVNEIDKLVGQIQRDLFERARDLSGLGAAVKKKKPDEDEEEELKNE